ncbi:hypothetical protein [Paludisphaera soli]|uniref:hypothetical protein n=1 Tax=Paludisphaera soli TaxID=2712865 RepID=UPI0013EB166E|nr:hypothetical protein [Paludisphaera soli]
MITIILETVEGAELDRASRRGNEEYLCRDAPDFPRLSEVDACSYNCFARSDMPELARELERIRDGLLDPGAVDHVDRILGLCRRCDSLPGSVLSFTPFEESGQGGQD